MGWTLEKPTQDGWYWFRRGATTMVRVFIEPSPPFAWECGTGDRTPLTHMDGEWYGPIDPPW